MPNSRQLARIASTCLRDKRVADVELVVGRHVVVDRGERQVRPAHPAARQPQPIERLRTRHLVHQVPVDVQERRLVGRRHDVAIPDLLEQCLGHFRFGVSAADKRAKAEGLGHTPATVSFLPIRHGTFILVRSHDHPFILSRQFLRGKARGLATEERIPIRRIWGDGSQRRPLSRNTRAPQCQPRSVPMTSLPNQALNSSMLIHWNGTFWHQMARFERWSVSENQSQRRDRTIRRRSGYTRVQGMKKSSPPREHLVLSLS